LPFADETEAALSLGELAEAGAHVAPDSPVRETVSVPTLDYRRGLDHGICSGDVPAKSDMRRVRPAAFAGTWYPGTARELRAALRGYLDGARPSEGPPPKAAIVPHAGYVYSAPVAATAYAAFAPLRGGVRRVVLLGPSHRVPLAGLAAPTTEAFDTPLGPVGIDHAALEEIGHLPQVAAFDAAHEDEHSLEIQLPFLIETLESFELVPLAVGHIEGPEVAQVLEALWGGPETVIVISSDLSHYHDYETACRIDRATARAIEELRGEAIGPQDACGSGGIHGLLEVGRNRSLEVRTADLRNSGDTAGPRDQVVGYGSFLFFEPDPS
jgi:AmmeMemoRadiSam system protein B